MTGTALPSVMQSAITDLRFDMDENIASVASMFTRAEQHITLDGGSSDRWVGVITTRGFLLSELATVRGFFAQVRQLGLFNFTHPDYSGAASAVTSCLVKDGSQTGTSLTVDGLPNTTLSLRAGEFFQVNEEFKVCLADVTSNGSGQATLTFWPALRASPADNSAVVFNTPRILAKLTWAPSLSTDKEKMSQPISFSFQEHVA